MEQQEKKCAHCHKVFIPERRHGRYCSPTCRQYSYLKKKHGESPDERTKHQQIVKDQLEAVPALLLEEENNISEQKKEAALIENKASPEENIPMINSEKEQPALIEPARNYPQLFISKEVQKEKEAMRDQFKRWCDESSENAKINFAIVNDRLLISSREFIHYLDRNVTREQAIQLLINLRALYDSEERKRLKILAYRLVIEEMIFALEQVLAEMLVQDSMVLPLKLGPLEIAHFRLFHDCMEEFNTYFIIAE